MTEPKRTIAGYDAIFECENCGITEKVKMANSILEFEKEIDSHEKLGHQGSISYAPWYLEEDIYTGKHNLTGGL